MACVELVARGATPGRSVAVLLQQRHAGEGLAAARARVALDAGVRLRVRAQVGPVGERALAVRAAERFLAGVRAQVPLQQPRPRERLAAQPAAARQRVRPDVHLERAGRRVGLSGRRAGRPRGDAVRARELAAAARRHGAVELAVLRDAVVRRVALAARLALEPRRARATRRRVRRAAETAGDQPLRCGLVADDHAGRRRPRRGGGRHSAWTDFAALLGAGRHQLTAKLTDDGLS